MKLHIFKFLAPIGLLFALSACGDAGEAFQPFVPTSVAAFGDGILDAGQNGGKLFTVNPATSADAAVFSPAQFIAQGYRLPALTPSITGGRDYAIGGASVAQTIVQINTHTASITPNAGELTLISAGMEDIIAQTQSVASGAQNEAAATAAIRTAATQLASRIKSLEDAGARHIVVVPVYDIGRTPFAIALGQASVASNLSRAFNDQLTLDLELTLRTRYTLMPANWRSRMSAILANASGTNLNATDAICTGAGATDASQCTTATLAANAATTTYVYADNRHPTPAVIESLSSFALADIRNRW